MNCDEMATKIQVIKVLHMGWILHPAGNLVREIYVSKGTGFKDKFNDVNL